MFYLQVVRFKARLNQTLASLERVIGCQLAALPDAQEMTWLPNMPTVPVERQKARINLTLTRWRNNP